VTRFPGLDPRLNMAMVGGVLGVMLVAALFAFRPATGSSFDSPGANASIPPPPFEPLGPDGLYEAFTRLGSVTVVGLPGTLSVSRAEDLVLPSGRVAAADAFFLDNPPFTATLSAGRHPVMLLHTTGADFGPAVAAAMVRVDGDAVVRWEGAQVREAPSGADPFVYGVDGGTGSFASPEAVARLKSMPSDAANALVDQLIAKYSASAIYTQTASITLDPSSGLNIVTFTSGFGDGGYASWFGFDASGKAVALLTSFDLIDDRSKPTGSTSPAGSVVPRGSTPPPATAVP
jgi:hypothetical protein